MSSRLKIWTVAPGNARRYDRLGLPVTDLSLILRAMFVVTEADAAAIRTVFEQEGELSAALRCVGGSQASLTTRKHGRVHGLSPDGCRCPCRRAL
jgi:hypothetical protein